VQYAILACVIRDGGLKMAVVARYSIIPAHRQYTSMLSLLQSAVTDLCQTVLTALMATCGVSVWVFVVSAIVSLPRPFIVVFVGVNLKAVADGCTLPVQSHTHTRIVTPFQMSRAPRP
jgi:hypothetical protein